MANINYNDIPDINTDWQGYSGQSVQKFIKEQLNAKMGVFHYDASNNRYLVFASEETKNEYILNPTLTDLVLGTFDAPFNYSAEITLISDTYNAVFLDSTGNYIDFTFKIVNKQGADTGENVNITYTFIRNAVRQSVTETRKAGEAVHFNVDKYLGEGTNTVMVSLVGQNTLAATSIAITYQVVNLSLTDEYDISNVYNITNGAATMEIPFTVSGYGTKIMEWYIDGEKLAYVKNEDECVDSTVSRTKHITISNLQQGRHSLQIRAYTTVNGEAFYTPTLYRDFFVYTSANSTLMLGVATTIPVEYGVLGVDDSVALFGVVQYEPYTLRFASYSPTNQDATAITITLDGENKGVVSSSNGIENSFTFIPTVSGSKVLQLTANDVTYTIPINIVPTSMDIEEITSSLAFAFDAMGKTNNSTDRDTWTDGIHTGTLNGFNYNDRSGWVNGRLEINAGASFSIDFAPLANNPTSSGCTVEMEWFTRNVSNDDAVICDLRNENGAGILITATKVSLISANGVRIDTEYKSGENVRVGFVINRSSGVAERRLSYIYTNGIVSRGDTWAATDSYTSPKTITFSGSIEAEVSLKAIRVYNTALTANNILNNFILYRDSVNEMMEVYDRNDIYEEGSSVFSIEKMSSRLPVMVVTGDIPTLENTSDKDTQIVVDIEYINMQDPSKSFKMVNAAMRPQGTSSMGYPKKNFRIYTQKLDSTIVYDANGNEIEDKLYSFKEGAQPVDCWCLKADYAESSGTHNTGIARLWNEALFNAQIDGEYKLRTEAQKKALEAGYKYDVRTTIDGFPILLFYRPSANDELIFIGKYNFNNDKSTESVFGFTGIPNFDNSRMQCWEVLNNGNPLALFTTTEGFDSGWSEAFESRYPDTKTPNTADLKAFCQWMTTVSKANFATEKWQHLNVYMMAAYWVYLMRHAAADQFVKNAMFTSEDGQHFYYILYDNDTINGLVNTGKLLIPPTATRTTVDESGEYVFAGHGSRLWDMLEDDAEFMSIVSTVDNALYSAGISYANTINIFDNEQADKWVERVYNQDAQYKYVNPFTERGVNNLFMLQGKRDLHRKWWLAKRFSIYDAKYVSGTYKSQAVELKCINNTPEGQKFTIKAGYPLDYGYGINNVPRSYGISLNVGESHTFSTSEVVNLGDPIRIYGATSIAELDLSEMAARLAVVTVTNVYDEANGTKLTKLIVGKNGVSNMEVADISGLKQAIALEYLDVQGMTKITALDLTSHAYIKTVKAYGSSIASIMFAKGSPVEYLELPDTMTALQFEQLPQLSSANIHYEDISKVYSVTVKSCPNISNDFNLVWNWVTNKTTQDGSCVLAMDNVDWSGVTGEQMARVANIGSISLKGKVVLSDITAEQGELFLDVFGDTVFDKNSEFYIDAPLSLAIKGPDSILEGESVQLEASVYPIVSGTTIFSLTLSRTGCSIDATTGVLTTTETGAATSSITVNATFTTLDGVELSAEKVISVVQRVYPTNISIEGSGNLKENNHFSWSTTTDIDTITGIYDVEWTVTGDLSSSCRIETVGNECYVYVDTLPSTSATGKLVVRIKKRANGNIVSTTSVSLNYTYVYPSRVNIEGPTTVLGGSIVTYTAVLTPDNVDIRLSYRWEITGSNYVTYRTEDNKCIVTTAIPDAAGSFTIKCSVSSSDGQKTVTDSQDVEFLIQPSYIIATYNVTSTTSSTTLLNTLNFKISDVEYMEIDGEEVEPVSSYKFSTRGEHIVKYTFKGLQYAFQSVTRLVKLDFSECNGSRYSSMYYMCHGCSILAEVEWGNCTFPNVTNIQRVFYNCNLVTISLSPFNSDNLYELVEVVQSCDLLEQVDMFGIGKNITSFKRVFYNCTKLKHIDFSPLANSSQPITEFNSVLRGCEALEEIDFTPLKDRISSTTTLDGVFNGCVSLKTIICPWDIAPTANISYDGSSSDPKYPGANQVGQGVNMLYVPIGATGYDTGAWLDPLQNPEKCDFTLSATL